MKERLEESDLRWGDALVIIAVIVLLAAALLVQGARRSQPLFIAITERVQAMVEALLPVVLP